MFVNDEKNCNEEGKDKVSKKKLLATKMHFDWHCCCNVTLPHNVDRRAMMECHGEELLWTAFDMVLAFALFEEVIRNEILKILVGIMTC